MSSNRIRDRSLVSQGTTRPPGQTYLKPVFLHLTNTINIHLKPNVHASTTLPLDMSTYEDDKAKAKNISKVAILQPTRNPTEVLEHLKKTCIALHSDGFRRGVNKIDPRTEPPFTAYAPREYDPARDNMSAAASAALTDAQREAATVMNSAFSRRPRRANLPDCADAPSLT